MRFGGLFTISSGGSIGREGPLVQLAAVLASLVGRWIGMPTARLRLLVACGAAGGIASAYNAPIGGALFVAEIILGTLSMESFGPLVFSSVIATLTVRQFLGTRPALRHRADRQSSSFPTGKSSPTSSSGWLAGLPRRGFCAACAASERALRRARAAALRAAGAGRADRRRAGHRVPGGLRQRLQRRQQLLRHGICSGGRCSPCSCSSCWPRRRRSARGAVGGVFTPTLFAGASLGYLFGGGVHAVWPGAPPVVTVFVLVGMGALLAATTHAPIMAIIMLFEMTLDYDIILPLMLACVVAHYTASAIEPASIYSESLKRKGAAFMRQQLAALRVADLMKKDPVAVPEISRFTDIAENFLTNRFNYLYVVGEGKKFKGAISLHDVKSYLNDPELASIVIARDIVREKFPTIALDESLADALGVFSRHDGERLPVTNDFDGPHAGRQPLENGRDPGAGRAVETAVFHARGGRHGRGGGSEGDVRQQVGCG